jgi:C-terminal processing protease CtpA/Prc
MRKILYLTIILSAGLIASCKKDSHNNNNTTTTSYINLDKDSIYYYEKEDYLWFDAIPAYNTFNPRSFSGSSDYEALGNEITAISQLKINPATGKPYEYYKPAPGEAKYSFVDDGTTTASLGGSNADFGFEPIYIAANDLRVKYVYPGSPADLAGIKRGYEITSINGSTELNGTSQSNINFIVNAVYYSNSITMLVKRYDNSTFTATFNTAAYTVNPVLTYKVFNEGNGHVAGYIAFNSFTDINNAKPKLNQAFNNFINNGVTDVIVDLRYNGGGSGETAAYLDDLIAPSSKTGSLMYTTYFNSNLQSGKSPLIDKKFGFVPADFKPENNQVGFAKALSLNATRVFFIVTSATASSSELTINNLRPAMDVQLVGDTTYGKPVGEIPIPLGSDGKYILYSPQIYVENSANQGDYYAGMTPGSGGYKGLLAGDDVTKDFGDSTELLLSAALHYVKTGTYAINKPQVQSLLAGKQLFTMQQQKAIVRKMDQHKFKPLVINKKHK